MFKPVSSKVDFVAVEHAMQEFWDKNQVRQKYLERNDGAEKRYSFIDGPITANNPMGVHHGWGRTYKDLFQRFKAMQGYDQRFQNGFDGQGLWIEVEVEKQLGLNSKRDIEKYGIDKFIELCKERVRKFAAIQTNQSIRLGYWMDWENSYHTMSDENNYSIWHFLKVCFERGWVYEGTDVMPWCPRCGTGLSQHEIVTEGYKEITHPGLFVRFPLVQNGSQQSAVGSQPEGSVPLPQGEAFGRFGPKGEGVPLPESLLIWTTTPWTLTANAGAAVHPDLTYVKVKVKGTAPDKGDEVLYLLKERLSVLKAEHEILREMPGKMLGGLVYRAPFEELKAQEGVKHRVVVWDEVSQSEGTGIVHNAPGAGQEDFALGKKEGLSVIAPLDEFGSFVEGFGSFTGKSVFEVNKPIYDSLREKGVFYRLDQYKHRYPVCWRCNTELVFRLVDEWFISMDELRHMIANVAKQARWIPEFGLQRELDWLNNMHDWMISKKRYWGLALPIYKCSCGHFEVIGSETELGLRAIEGWDKFQGHSPHRPWIDHVKIECPRCGGKVSRIKDVGNPWLDAGIVPFSTLQYRHDKEYWKKWFPADLVSESFPGQFRNWFYSLLTMSTALENATPFKNIFTYALMRDEKGEEMHKSKGNAIWFEDAAEKMGADSMRWLYSRQNPPQNLNFGFNVADEVRRQFIIPLRNVYSFFVTYANIDNFDPTSPAPALKDRAELDRWIISELNKLVADVTNALENYSPDGAAKACEEFVEYLSNWYVRRSRRRFWKSDVDQDKQSAYLTLYECLTTLTRLLAPFMPFLMEEMYQNLVVGSQQSAVGKAKESVHLDDFPVSDPSKIDTRLSDATRLAMKLSSLGRSARARTSIKVRQPVEKLLVKLRATEEAALLEQVAPQVRDELNVKQVEVLKDETQVMTIDIKPNLALLGPEYGANMRKVVAALQALPPMEVYAQASSGKQVKAGEFTLEPQEVLVNMSDKPGYSFVTEGGYGAAVTTAISPELALEGHARELVHLIQNMRRTADFDIADYIVTYYQGDAELDRVVATHGDYIRQETLSRDIVKGAAPSGAHAEQHKVNGMAATIGVKRA
ncbi:MAG: isoleucine--tRNA ligase [SAR202 cluster bacterium]|nr:isoleucine--tRNA ligase [SAR202 cluster bacterium]